MKSFGSVLILAVLVAACSTIEQKNKIDYKSASTLPPLQVPQDLAVPPTTDRFAVPDSGTTTYSAYSHEQGQKKGAEQPASPTVLPEQDGMHVERAGSQRWLVVDAEPDKIWPLVREFWQDSGFLIAKEIPEAGIMETDWAENRAKIPQSSIRSVLSKVLDDVYSYPERDKFRTRIERGENGTSEIYISHRGMYEVLTSEGRAKDDTRWEVRPSDPELEAEMLYRLMARLGAKNEQVQQAKNDPPPPPRAAIAKPADNAKVSSLLLTDPFDRAWRRVGLALDRVGFTVEDRDRSKGLYYVRYADPEVEGKKPSGLSKLAFWRSKPGPQDEQFQISVADASAGSEVKILNAQGQSDQSQTASRILALLQEELK
ncbi:MAG TPA: outer membrane protein assembly factor BamC [Burkholderiales bacterium]|nr:outer membrane protein assembly factor BamC [Burkholderiales bacterium]